MQIDTQELQNQMCTSSAADAKEFLDYISKNPPKPYYGGCVKTALRTFLRHLQFGAVYHEYGQYQFYKKALKAESSALPVDHSFAQEISVCAVPDVQTSNDTQNISNEKLFTKTEKFKAAPPYNNNGNNYSNGSSDVKRRNTSQNTSHQDVYFAETALSSVIDDTRRNTGNGNAVMIDNEAVASLETNCDFLSRMALSEKLRASDIITSLGYDINVCQGKSRKEEQMVKDEGSRNKSSCLKALFSDRTYCFIMLIIMWAYSLRCIMFFFGDYEILLMTKLIPSLWSVMVTATNTVCFVSCVRNDHLATFFYRWGTHFRDPVTRALGLRGTLSTKYVTVALIIMWIIVAMNMASVIFIMCMHDEFSAGMNLVLYLTGQRSIPIIVVSTLIIFYNTMAWVGSTTFIIILCHIVCSHFEEFNQVLKLHILAASNRFPQHLKLLRERHLAMSETVVVLDRFIMIYTSIFYSVSIGLACVLLYQLIEVPMDTTVTLVAVMWLISGALFMTVTTYHMANVNVAIHSAGDDLYTIQTNNLTVEQLAQLQLFLAKVNGPSMGFTVLGMVTITRELMLTLFGLFITYAIVLLQF